jgi:hypothetical protein
MSHPEMSKENRTTIHTTTAGEQNPAIETIQQVMKGELPSNAQAEKVFEGTKEFLQDTRLDPNVSSQASKVMYDAERVVDATQQLLKNKNADESLQKFAQHGSEAIKQNIEPSKEKIQDLKSNLKGEKLQQAEQKTRVAGQAALNMIKYTASNADFRTWFLELITVLHDVFIEAEKTSSTCDKNQQQCLGRDQAKPMFVLGQNENQPGNLKMANKECDQKQGQQKSQCQEKKGQNQSWKLNEEQKRQLSYRFITLLRRLNNNNPEFAQACRNFLDAIEDIKNEVKQAKNKSSSSQFVTEDVKKAKEEAKKIVESFSGRKLDKLLDSINQFAQRLNDDQELDQWMRDIRKVIEDCLTNPQTVDGEDFYKRVDELVDRGNCILQGKYKSDYQYILDEIKSIFESIKNDPDVKKLQGSIERFLKNFTTTDEQGNRKFNNDLLGQMRKFIVPLLLKQLERVPIPNFEGSNEDMDFRLENVVLNAAEILPDHVHIFMSSDIDLNIKDLEADKARSRALLKITNMKTKIENVKFWYKRKTIPRIEDHGIADIALKGEGASLYIHLQLGEPLFGDKNEFKFSKIRFDIDKLQIDIKETQHTILMPIIMAVMEGRFRRELENSIEERIKSVCHDIESGLNELLQKYPPSKLPSMISESMTSALPSTKKPTETHAQEFTPSKTAF